MEGLNLSTMLELVFMAGLSLRAISSLKIINVPKEFGLRDFSAPCFLPLDLPLQTLFLLQVTFQRLRVQVNVYRQVTKSNSVPLILKHMGSDCN